MSWLIYFILGWFGKNWWPGVEVDVPKPGDPGPWWRSMITGVVAGGVAVWVTGAVGWAASNPMPGIAAGSSEPMPGVVLAIATGCVVGKIGGGLLHMAMPSRAG